MASESREEVMTGKVRFEDADFNNLDQIAEIAKLYIAVPLSWDPNYKFTEEGIRKLYDWLMEKRETIKCVLAMNESKIVGLHILAKEANSTECFIKTLWLEKSFRGLGFGDQMKKQGEAWAIAQGAKKMITHVMLDNPSMLETNKRRGFKPVKIEMAKILET
jgi:GNAT superfamily N-acetyltransferase